MSEFAIVAIIDAATDALINGPRKITAQTPNYRNVGFQPGGQPPPRSGSLYIALDDGGESASGQENYLAEVYTLSVIVSIRLGQQAQDQYDKIYRELGKKFSSIVQGVKNCLHGQQDIREAASLLLPTGSAPFTCALFYEGSSGTELKGPEWSGEMSDKLYGWAVKRLRFSGMRRILTVGSIN